MPPPVPVGEGLERRRLAELRRVVDLVVAGGPDPRLVRHAALGEKRPHVPTGCCRGTGACRRGAARSASACCLSPPSAPGRR